MISRKLALISAMSLGMVGGGAAVARVAEEPKRRQVRVTVDQPTAATSANINRHTGKPHEHRREIARRARQASSGDKGRVEG